MEIPWFNGKRILLTTKPGQAIVEKPAAKAEADAPWTPSTVGFGPGEPLRPGAAEEPIRREDFLVGRNYLFTPRAAEQRAITFAQMRNLADSYGILRTIIEKRKDELKGLEWDIAPAVGYEDKHEELQDAISKMRAFWQFPDKEASFDQWLGILAEDIFVIDALSLYINHDKKGDVISLDTIDGSTIWMLVDDRGRVPNPPEPAYEQNVKNFPRTWWTKDELIYRPYNLRSQGLYGFSHVESIILTVNIAFRRELQFLEWFRSSNLPAALVQAPESWTPQQIAEWQTQFDNMLAGNLAARSRLNLVPGGAGQPVIFSPLTFDARFDEWLARVICARFGVSPTPYVSEVNRAQAQTMEEASKEESLVPIQQHFKALFDFIIQKHMKQPSLQFIWTETQHYRLQDAQLDDLLLKSGVITLDQVRRNRGDEPYEGEIGSKPMVWTAGGPLLLEDIVNRRLPSGPGGGAPAPGGAPAGTATLETPQDGVEEDKQPKADEVAEQIKASKYSPDQPRDEEGQWSETGAGGAGGDGGTSDIVKLKGPESDKWVDKNYANVKYDSAQLSATKLYSTSGSVNPMLRSGEVSPSAKEFLKNFDGAIDKSPLPETVEVYRGFGGGVFPEANMTGKTFKDKAYLSATFDQNIAERFAVTEGGDKNQVVMKILAHKGTGALPMRATGMGVASEKELVFGRETKLRVTSDTRQGAKRIIEAEIIR